MQIRIHNIITYADKNIQSHIVCRYDINSIITYANMTHKIISYANMTYKSVMYADKNIQYHNV